MKRLICLLLGLCIVLGLAGCGSEKFSQEEEEAMMLAARFMEEMPVVYESYPNSNGARFSDGTFLTWEELKKAENGTKYGYNASAISDERIAEKAFYNCLMLEEIDIPKSVTIVDDDALSGCDGLIILKVSEGVMILGSIDSCLNLQKIYLPSTITKIGQIGAWNGLPSLSSVTYNGTCEELLSIDGGGKMIPYTYKVSGLKSIICTDGEISTDELH